MFIPRARAWIEDVVVDESAWCGVGGAQPGSAESGPSRRLPDK
jgi:hypothetical protein